MWLYFESFMETLSEIEKAIKIKEAYYADKQSQNC